MKRKVLSVLLSFALCLQMIPMSVFATEITPAGEAVGGEATAVTVASDSNAVAAIGGQEYETLAEAFENVDAGETITLLDDIDMSDWTSVDVRKKIVLDGAGNKITDLGEPLVNNSSADFTIKDLTVSGADIMITSASGSDSDTAAAALVQWANGGTLTIDSVSVIDSTIEGDGYVAAMVGFVDSTAGGVVVKGGTIEGNTLIAGGTVGSVAGHTYADVTVEGITVSGNSLTSTSDEGTRPDKVGLVVGRLSAKTVSVSAEVYEDNAVEPAGTNIDRIIGSIPGGTAVVTGGEYPSNPTVTEKGKVSIADGMKVVENEDGTWTVAERTAEDPVEAADQDELNEAIRDAVTGTPTTIQLTAGTYTLLGKNDGSPDMVEKEITFLGGKDVVFDLTGMNGATWHTQDTDALITFDGVTVKWSEDNEGYQGFANADKVIYEDCIIYGTQFMGGDAEFINCVFEAENTAEKGYAVYGRGVGTLTFTDCEFKTDGRAIMLYQDQTTEVNVVMEGCTFSDNGTYDSKPKAVVETGDGQYKTSKFNITIENCEIIKGFEENNSTSPLWGNKDDIPFGRLVVVIDGETVNCPHNYAVVSGSAEEATCSKDGKEADQKCSDCGHTITGNNIPATGIHVWDGGEVKVEAGPDNDGLRLYTCTFEGCTVTKTEVIPKVGHSYDNGVVTAPTCTEQGYTTYTCTTCEGANAHSYTDNYVDATGHTITAVETAPTCTTKGYTTHKCSVCGYSYTDSFKAVIAHNWETKEVVDATSNTEGMETSACSACGAIKTEVLPMIDCVFTEKVTAPTCTEQGYTTYTCTTCTGDAQNHSYVGDYVSATGHNLNTVVTDPTCTAKGYTTHTCKVSGCKYTVKSAFTEMIAHSYVYFNSKPATADAEGENVYKCSSCDVKRIEVIPASGHSFTAAITEEATCVEDGEKTFTCTTCAGEGKTHTYTEVILATGHSWDEGVTTEATCQTSGYTTHTCAACDAKKVTGKTDMRAHEFDADGNCTNDGCTAKNASASENREAEVTALNSLSDDHDKLDYTTVDEIKEVMAEAGNVSDDMTSALYDISLTVDGKACTANNFPAEGYVFQIGVPNDAAAGTDFVVSHMITETYGGNLAGDIETLESWMDETEENICFRTYSTSPVLLSYTKNVVNTSPSYDDDDSSDSRAYTTKKPEVKAGSWKQDAIGWWYENADGSYPTSCWMELEYNGTKEWYHFDAVGYMQTGWFTDTDGNIYYLNPVSDGTQGRMVTGWQLISDKWYYFNTVSDGTKGAMFVNRSTPDGYQVDANGVWIQ